MNGIRIGVVGYGYWGPNLVRNFVELPGSTVVAVSDIREERLVHMKAAYPDIASTTDYRDLFSMNLDAVAIVTPPSTHYSIANDCLDHGLNVFVEKPLTLSSEDAEKLVEKTDRNGLILMVGHTFEYNPAVRALKELIDSGQLGEIYYVDAVRVNLGLFQPGLNVLWDLAPHDLSILRYLLGEDPISVSAQGAHCVTDGVHDVVYLSLTFPGGTQAHVHISWLDPCKIRQITIVGSRMMVVYDDVEPVEKIRIYDRGVEVSSSPNVPDEIGCSYRHGDVVIPSIRFAEPLRLECQHFIDCINDGTEPQSSGRVGAKVVTILESANQSLQDGGLPKVLCSLGGTDRRRACG